MHITLTKQTLLSGNVALGSSQGHLRSSEIPQMLAAAGFDWIFIDTEHGSFTPETMQDLIRSSLSTSITPIVRVADFQYSLVARALDMGAQGIILPRVESTKVLEEAISWTKFPPEGRRGFGLTPPQIGYVEASFDEITAHANENTLVIFQIESQTALERADELISVPDVDAVMIGPADLSISLGVAGDMEHPKLVDAILGVIESCEKYGRFPSIQVRDPVLAKTWIQRGMKLVGCSQAQLILWDAVQAMAADLRKAREDT